MKTNLRYQNGSLYEHHGAWYVRYRQRISKEDGSCNDGWHAFRRGLASNLYEIGAQDKVVQRILRHSKPHVTRERYIKIFGRTVFDAVEKVQARIEELRQAKADRQQLQLKFGGSVIAESPTGGCFPPFSPVRPPFGYQIIAGSVVSY